MKKAKSIISAILCAAILLSCAPVLNLNLFGTQASAASYTKKHEKEYYYAPGTKFIANLVLGYSSKNADKAKAVVTGVNYTVINKDLNDGAGGNYIFLGYRSDTDPTNSIKDLRIRNANNQNNYTAPENKATYTAVGKTPISEAGKLGDGVVDLNMKAGGDYLYYFATKNVLAGDPIVEITIDTNKDISGYETVKFLESANFNVIADANKGAKGDYIYTHLKRLPQIDTTKLRSAMETAATAIANTSLIEESKASLKTALAAAEQITNAYDNFRAGTDAYSSVYDQTKIDAAEKAIKEAMDELAENIDDSGTPKVTFYVPETVYLDPNDNQSFRYFYGVDTSGKPVKNISTADAAKGAMVYFDVTNCTPTSVKITVEASSNNATDWKSTASGNLSSVTYGGTTNSGAAASTTGNTYSTFPVNIQCTGGKMNSAVPAGGYRFLKWTAHYVVDGFTLEAYAYSLCYAPYDKPAAAASRAYTNRGINHELHQIAWISGITGSSGDGNRTNNTTGFDPLKGVISTPTNATNNGGTKVTGNVYFSGTSGTSFLTDYSNGEVNAQAQAVAPKGSLVLDSTRFSNLKYVPNLKIGYLISYSWEGSNSCKERRFGYYFSDVSNISYEPASENNGKDLNAYTENRGTYIVSDTKYETTTEKVDREYCRPRLVYNDVWNKEVTSSQTVRVKGAARFGTKRDSIIEDNNGNVNCAGIVPLEVTVVNKALLRAKVNVAVSNALQENWFAAGYDVYQNSILAMAIHLENPASSVITGNTDRSKLERVSGTVTTSYIRDAAGGADYNGNSESPIIGTSSNVKSFTGGEDVSVPYNDITGYTLSGYTVCDETGVISTGTVKADKNYFVKCAGGSNLQWKFVYMPNSYTASYDPNGGSFNGSSTVTNTTAYYQSKYSVGSVDGTTIAEPTREGYTFTGWACDADGATYNTDAQFNWDYTKTVKFTAQWSIKSYTVTFKNGDDVLQESKWEYNTTPTYNGATPTKSKDDSYEYTFSGWTPEISAVKDDIAYYAQYSKTAHDYRCDILDGKQHQYVCNDCGYKKAPEKHKLVYVKTDNGYSYTCSECGYSYTTTAKAYSVEFSCDSYSAANNAYIKSECEKYAAANPPVYNEAKSKNYYIATIKAPMTITENGQKMYFVYWLDAETGEKVGTYTTYRYFQTKSSKFTPVYATQQEYYAMRNQAVIASRVVDCRLNDNGSYSLLAEHSVASSCESIKGHGVIYTTEAANAGMLTTDNDNVEKKAALKSANALTGLLEVSVDLHGANTVWARTYVIDANNEVHYGTVRQFDVTAGTSSAGDEIITLGAESYDLTDLNSDAEAPTIEDEPTEKSPLEILKTVFSKLIEIINEIISYFTKPGAKK